MIEYSGNYGEAIVYAPTLDGASASQIMQLVNSRCSEGEKIRIMPDVHAGSGCVIGLTMTVTDKIVPSMVGVDIGCGVLVIRLEGVDKIDYQALDDFIRKEIPIGFNVRETSHANIVKDIGRLHAAEYIDANKAGKAMGTLGGGNHFIEIDEDESGMKYLLVHSGSRKTGMDIATYHQKIAQAACPGEPLPYLEGVAMRNYLDDVLWATSYAACNRMSMAIRIAAYLGCLPLQECDTVHNYVERTSQNVFTVRKGAVSAKAGETLIVPLNMRDGSLLCRGKGNIEWNNSAPHGAGRIASRSVAKEAITMEEYADSMRGIFSTSVCKGTIDESPMAYKDGDHIANALQPTAMITRRLKTVYNLKAGGK